MVKNAFEKNTGVQKDCNMEIWTVRLVWFSYLGDGPMAIATLLKKTLQETGNISHQTGSWEKSSTQTCQMVGDMLVLWSLVL